jgi:hypothetical protein
MIKIEADFNMDDIDNYMNEEAQAWYNELAKTLMKTGKLLVDKAQKKMKPDQDLNGKAYGNLTWNLRSSIGCGLIFQNELVESYFPMGKGDSGRKKGIAMLKRLATESQEDVSVIVVAGEEYSEFVQAKGFDVTKMAKNSFESEFMKIVNS